MYHRIISRLDIKSQNLVKGIHLEGIRVLGQPEKFAKYYYEQGADELLYQDVVASLYNRNSLHEIIQRTAQEIFIPLTVGGGLRSIEDIRNVLRAGADKVALNTAAIKNPDLIKQAANIFGSSTIVISIEAKKMPDGSYEAYIDNGREKTGVEVMDWAKKVVNLGAGEIFLTSIDREGTGKGFDIELVKAVTGLVNVPVVASGGAGKKEHVLDVLQNGLADAVSLASVLHYHALKQNHVTNTDHDNQGTPFNTSSLSLVEDFSLPELKLYLEKNNISSRNITNSLQGDPVLAT